MRIRFRHQYVALGLTCPLERWCSPFGAKGEVFIFTTVVAADRAISQAQSSQHTARDILHKRALKGKARATEAGDAKSIDLDTAELECKRAEDKLRHARYREARAMERYHDCYIDYWRLRGRERLRRVRAKHADVRSAHTAALLVHSDLVDVIGSDGEEELQEPYELAMSSFSSDLL